MAKIRKRIFRKNGSLYRVDPNDKNDIVEIREKNEWKSTKIAWKDFIWNDDDHFFGFNFESILSCRDHYKEKEKTEEEINQTLMDFMEWFGHDYREREIQMEIQRQIEKYSEIFPHSEGYGILVCFDEDPSDILPVATFGYTEGLRILKIAIFLSSESPQKYHKTMTTIFVNEIVKLKEDLRQLEKLAKDQEEKNQGQDETK